MHDYYFILDGVTSTDYGIHLQRPLTFSKPSRKYSVVEVPGRDGTLHITEDAFSSVSSVAKCFVLGENAEELMGDAVNWLYGARGTRRLETPEDPDVYREVLILDGMDTDVRVNRLGVFDVAITAQPQRWLKSGETALDVINGQTLENPGLASKPLIEVSGSGSGSVTVGGVTVELLDIPGTLLIDCVAMWVYNQTGSHDDQTSTPDGFPVIPPGESEVSWSGGVTALKIIPRWWKL